MERREVPLDKGSYGGGPSAFLLGFPYLEVWGKMGREVCLLPCRAHSSPRALGTAEHPSHTLTRASPLPSRQYAPRCSVCAEPIMPEPGREETVRVVALDKNFHMKCYKCEVRVPVTPEGWAVYGDTAHRPGGGQDQPAVLRVVIGRAQAHPALMFRSL